MSRLNLPPGEPVRLEDTVQYADGSVVSRALVNRNSYTLTLFAFDEEQSLSEHSAPFDALLEVLDGECEVRIADNTLSLRRGSLILMPANVPHAVRAITRFKMLLTMLKA